MKVGSFAEILYLCGVKHSRISQENIVYTVAWLLLFVTPLLAEALQTWSGTYAFEWRPVLFAWHHTLVFFGIFLLHNWLLAPLLLRRQKRWLYGSAVAVVVALFTLYECSHRPPQPPDGGRPHASAERIDGPQSELLRAHRPPVLVGQHDIISVIILLLMLGINMGAKYYYRQQCDAQRVKELEQERLEQQLTYLRYQVNPHFLMNTLNNIHALIDIDPEGAQNAIVELSRLLRYTLYEADKQTVPLSRELEFLKHYIALMRIRYPEQVDICFDTPDPVPSAQVPPLLYATFVENAFKHGVSYRQPSFVHVRFSIGDGRLSFTCRNSRPAQRTSNAEGGVGLRNVQQRLKLLFPGTHTLDIQEAADTYTVQLDIPLTT